MAHHNHHRRHWHASRALVAYRRLVLVINERPAWFQGQSKKTSTLCSRNFFFLCYHGLLCSSGERVFFLHSYALLHTFSMAQWYCNRKAEEKQKCMFWCVECREGKKESRARSSLCGQRLRQAERREGAWTASKTWQKAVFHCWLFLFVVIHAETDYKVFFVACILSSMSSTFFLFCNSCVCSRNEENHLSESSYSRCPVYVCVSAPAPS